MVEIQKWKVSGIHLSLPMPAINLKDVITKFQDLNKRTMSMFGSVKEDSIDSPLEGILSIPDMFSQTNDYFEEAAKLIANSEDQSVALNCIPGTAGELERCLLSEKDKQMIHKLVIQTLYRYKHNKANSEEDEGGFTNSIENSDYIKSVENMLEISEKQAIAWRKAAEKECLYNRVLSISLEAGTELPVSDANGKADPYCRFGLVTRRALGRNEKGKIEELVPKGSVVHTSQVIPMTLEPVWNENFEFGLSGDELVLIEVWDRDEESEKFMSKTGVKGFKAKIKDHLASGQDDFMGRCVVDFAKFDTSSPSSAWYELRSHSGKSYRGKIHLIVQTHVSLENSLLHTYRESRLGANLLEKFLLAAGRYCIQMNIPFPDKRLPEPYFSVSNAIQDLLIISEFESVVAKLPLLAKYITKYTYVRNEICMTTLILTSLWKKEIEIMPRKCEDTILEHFYSIYQHELQLLDRTSELVGIAHIPTVLNSLKQIFQFLKFTHRVPEDLILNDILKERIIKNIDTWVQLEFKKATLSPYNSVLDQAASLSDVCCSAAQYLANSLVGYQKPFNKIGIAYYDITYQRIDELLADKVKEFLNTYNVKEHFLGLWKRGENRDSEILENSKGAIVIFRLFQKVRDVYNLSSDAENIPECGWSLQDLHKWFKPCVLTWIDIIRSIAKLCLERIVKYDSGKIIDTYSSMKVTSSALDTSLCFEQCYQFYERLQWPLTEVDTFNFVTEHTVVGGDIAAYFSNLLLNKLEKTIKEGIETNKRFTIEENVCLLLNNVSLAEYYLKEMPSRLNWESTSDNLCPELFPVSQLQEVLDNFIEDVKNTESQMIIVLGNSFERQFSEIYKKFLSQNHDIEFDSAVDPLMQWMVSNIQVSCQTLTEDHFIMLLTELWSKVTKILIEYKDSKLRADGEYKRLYLSLEVLYQFFYGKGDGLSEERLHTVEFENLQNYFKLYNLETKCLIDMYYCELAQTNTTLQQNNGNLSFSVYYQSSKGTLNISIIRGENFPIMDIFTGSCNPYISVDLLPKQKEMKTLKTKCHKKTLSSLFNEVLSVEIPLNKLLANSKIVQLSLWNWDRLSQHEYAGSIYLDLHDVPIISSLFEDTKGKAKPITLNFMFPTETPILKILGERLADKEAVLFLKNIRGLMSAQSKIQDKIAWRLMKFSRSAK